MRQRSIRCISILFAIAFTCATVAFAQSTDSESLIDPQLTLSSLPLVVPDIGKNSSWEAAQVLGPKKGKILVVTLDEPKRRHTCRIRSFTADKLVCARAIGEPRTYLPQQVAELIIPGDDGMRMPLFLGFNAGLGAAIWGTVVLAAACPPCAAATGVAALIFLAAAGVTAYADGQPERVIYVAPVKR